MVGAATSSTIFQIGWAKKKRRQIGVINSGRAYHIFETMVEAHCVQDEDEEGGFTLHWSFECHRVRGWVRVYNLKTTSTIFSKKREGTLVIEACFTIEACVVVTD